MIIINRDSAMKLVLATIVFGWFLSYANAQDVGVPGVFDFHGPISRDRDRHHDDWDNDWRHAPRGYWRHHHHRCWDEDEGEWKAC